MYDEPAPSPLDTGAENGSVWRLPARQRAAFILFEATLIPVAVAVGWLVSAPPLSTFAWDLEAAGWGIAAAVPLVAAVIVASRWPLGPWRSLAKLADEMLLPLFRNWTLGELAFVSALAGVGEEMLFRGVVQAALGDALGAWVGLTLASVLFGLVHFLSPSYALYAALVGAFLGLLWIVTGNLLAPIVTHGVYDFTVLVYLVRIRKAPMDPKQPFRIGSI